MIALAGALYLLLLLAIGLATLRRTRTARDYFLAGGRLGFTAAVFGTMASIMSGFVFVGGPGLFYQIGLSSFWITVSSSFTGALMCWLLAPGLRRMAAQEDCLTIPDVIYQRFGCRFSSGLAGLAILLGLLGYLGTQIAALGVILSSIFNISFVSGALLGLSVLAFYTVGGGMLASIYTDVVQGALMIWATTLIFFFAIQASGGLAQTSRILLAGEPKILDPLGGGPFLALGWFFVFSVGALGQPHVVHKLMMVRDMRVLRWFPLALAAAMILCGLIWLGVGMAVKAQVLAGRLEPLAAPDQAVTIFLSGYTPGWLSALAYAGILSAIMSTADSFSNIGAAALTRDLPRALGRRIRREVLWGRVFSLLLFLAAALFALRFDTLVAYLGIFGFGVFAASLMPVLVLGLNWDGCGRWAARTGIAFGLVCSLALEVLSRTHLYPFPVPASALALIVSLLVFLMVGWATQSRGG